MYINEFWCGVIATIIVEVASMIVYIATQGKKVER